MDELRRSFHDRIASLRQQTEALLDDTEVSVRRATAAVLARPPEGGEMVAAGDRVSGIEAEVVDLLAQQGPVARDLRVILASLFIAETAGLCLGLCGTLSERAGTAAGLMTPSMAELTSQIGDETSGLIGEANGAWKILDAGLACEVISASTASRELQRRFLGELLSLHVAPVDLAVDLGMAARAYARLTDHAVEIAGRVVFAATGGGPPPLPPEPGR